MKQTSFLMQRTGREQRKKQPCFFRFVSGRFNKQRNWLTRLVLGGPKVSGFLHLPHSQNLKILYRGLKWVQNSTDSLITTVLSQGYILRETSGNGKGKGEAYSKDRKEGDEPPVVQVQLAGQTLGHIFSMTSPNWQYVDRARIMPDTQ